MHFKLILLIALFAINLQSSVCGVLDLFNDVEFQQTLIKCQLYCAKSDPNYHNTQTCKNFPEKKIVLTDCEVTCAKISEDDLKKAGTCTCVSGKCVGDEKPPASPNSNSAAVKYFPLPELLGLGFILYSIILAM